MMPFSKELRQFCNECPDFLNALKVIYPKRFISLHAIVTSFSPLVPEDQIIGMYVYDYRSRPERFKQDFIINKGRSNKEFILYTKLPNRQYGKSVRDIGEFFTKYSKGKYYVDTHHVSFEQLPDEIKPRALRARRLAETLKVTGLRELIQEELNDFDRKLRASGV